MLPAVIAAVEASDAALGVILAAVERAGGVALVTADHGNAEQMLEPDGSPHTAHTTNPVPLVVDARGRAPARGGSSATSRRRCSACSACRAARDDRAATCSRIGSLLVSDGSSLAVLRERDFALFFWGQFVSVLGDGIFPIALAFAVLDLGGSPTASASS